MRPPPILQISVNVIRTDHPRATTPPCAPHQSTAKSTAPAQPPAPAPQAARTQPRTCAHPCPKDRAPPTNRPSTKPQTWPQNKPSTRPSSARNCAAPYLELKQDPLWPNRTKPDLTEHLTKIFPLSVRPSSVTPKDQSAPTESKLPRLAHPSGVSIPRLARPSGALAQLSAPTRRAHGAAKLYRRTTG